jgi:hypothetical protein
MGPETPNPLGEDARQVADAAVAQWRAIDAALSPIIGRRGVAALYKRTVHLASAERPWLAAAYRGPLGPVDADALHAALALQTRARAAEASEAMAGIFRALLSSLIGAALTEHLLPPAQPRTSGGLSAANESS